MTAPTERKRRQTPAAAVCGTPCGLQHPKTEGPAHGRSVDGVGACKRAAWAATLDLQLQLPRNTQMMARRHPNSCS